MAKPKPEDIELNVNFTLDWKVSEIAQAGFYGAMEAMQQVLEDAEAQAKANVAPGHGPGPHPHRTEHGFEWEDTGKLQDAIHKTNIAGGRDKEGRFTAEIAGGLEVDPIEVDAYTDPDGKEHPTRTVPYGAYLELGWTPKIPLGISGGWGTTEGTFTRYPFLAPAMYMATQNFIKRAGIRLLVQMQDAARRAAKKKSIFFKEKIDMSSMTRMNWEGALEAIQPVRDLDNE